LKGQVEMGRVIGSDIGIKKKRLVIVIIIVMILRRENMVIKLEEKMRIV
jgi:hypothetical protein